MKRIVYGAALIAAICLSKEAALADQTSGIPEAHYRLYARLAQDDSAAGDAMAAQAKDLEKANAEYQRASAEVQNASQFFGRATPWESFRGATTARSGRPLIIRSSAADPKTLEDMKEDLNIMTGFWRRRFRKGGVRNSVRQWGCLCW